MDIFLGPYHQPWPPLSWQVFVRELYQRYGVQLDDEDARAALKPKRSKASAGKKTKKKEAEKQR